MLIRLAVLAALFGFLFGFDEGVIAGALPFIQKTFPISHLEEGFMTAAVPLGAIAGAIAAALWSDATGRRRVLIWCSILFGIGSVICAAAPAVFILTIGRLMLGLAIGASALAAPQFLAELAPPRIRGAVVSAFQLMITVGILVSYFSDMLLEPLEDWRLMLAIGIVPAVVTLAGIARAPESPRWLVLNNRAGEAAEVLTALQPKLSQQEVKATVDEISASVAKGEPEPRWNAFLSPRNRPMLVFAVMAFVLQQFSGINAVIYYAPRILELAGFEGTANQLAATVGIGAINVIMTIAAMLIIDRLGRRKLMLIGFAGAAASLAAIAAVTATGNPELGPVALGGVLLYISFFAISLGPLPWLYMAELFPLRLRSRGMALASVANWSTNFLVVFLFPVVLAAIGISATFGVFAACCVFGLFYAWARAPETKNVSLEDLEEQLAGAPRKAAA